MVATLVMAAALTAGYEPVYKIPGPALKIPCKVDSPQAVERVQLYVSDNRGQTWAFYDEITPEKDSFVFSARKPGEYWFTARLKKKDGTLDPARTADFVVMQKVEVETGTGYSEPVPPPLTRSSAADVAKELEDELTRVEMELIRQEIKKLSEAKKLTPETGDKIDRLRARLREIQDRGRREGDDPVPVVRGAPPRVYPIPGNFGNSLPDDRIPPTITPALPVIPVVPAPNEAPMPRVRETR
jgi:hypothetical protein